MIGIYGGTFDPVHFGHLRPVLEVCEALALRQVRFIPAGRPPHREQPGASAMQRLSMVRAAISDVPKFCVDDRELRRQGPSYMVDTLRSLRAELGNTPLCLILGLDAYVHLDSWHEWHSLLELAHLVVMQRPGTAWHRDEQRDATRNILQARIVSSSEVLRQQPAGKIFFQPVTQLDISATRIRQWLAEGKDIRYLVPDSVRELIVSQHIYG